MLGCIALTFSNKKYIDIDDWCLRVYGCGITIRCHIDIICFLGANLHFRWTVLWGCPIVPNLVFEMHGTAFHRKETQFFEPRASGLVSDNDVLEEFVPFKCRYTTVLVAMDSVAKESTQWFHGRTAHKHGWRVPSGPC